MTDTRQDHIAKCYADLAVMADMIALEGDDERALLLREMAQEFVRMAEDPTYARNTRLSKRTIRELLA